MVYDSIKKLVAYGVNTGLVEPEDEIYVTNRLLEVMELDEYRGTGRDRGRYTLRGNPERSAG